MELRAFVREYEAGRDRPAVCSWALARGMKAVPEVILPKLGVVACWEAGGDARAAGWLYMDNSIGVARVEFLNTQPGMALGKARRATQAVVEYLEEAARGFGYVIIQCIASRAVAREAKGLGFKVIETDLCSIMKEIGKKE
jgi:hypothetical protein